MDPMVTGNLIYLILLLVAVGAMFFGGRRRDMGQMGRYLLVWGGVFLALLAGILLFNRLFGIG